MNARGRRDALGISIRASGNIAKNAKVSSMNGFLPYIVAKNHLKLISCKAGKYKFTDLQTNSNQYSSKRNHIH